MNGRCRCSRNGQTRRLCAVACIFLLSASLQPARAAAWGPFVQSIDAESLGDHVDLIVQFACSARYVRNAPLNHGSSTLITMRLGPDCGVQLNSLPPELPLVGGGGDLISGARMDSVVPGEITLELTWSRPLDFVMAPTATGLGLRVRLLNTSLRKGRAYATDAEAGSVFAVNLESARTSFGKPAVEAAATKLLCQAYVSEIDVDDEHWYRLRAGPFTTRQEAERVLKIAQQVYPRAWLADNDEQVDLASVERAGVQSTESLTPTDPPLSDEQRAELLRQAREYLDKHEYPLAVDVLNRLMRQPEYATRADAQELLGLTRERAGQLAQAKAEYQAYLRRYADRPNAARVRARLQALVAASIAPATSSDRVAQANARWTLAGSAAVSYQYGKDQTVVAGTTTTTNTINSALFYGDFLLRERGERYDFTARLNVGYTNNVANTFGGSQDRTTAAYAELTDRELGLTGRLGRQSLASQGIIGLFDGLFVGYQASPRWSVSAAAGLPAYTSFSPVSSQQKFATVAAEVDPWHQSWVFDAYLFDEINGGATERRSVGFQTRYSGGARMAVMLVDYDIAFRQLNSATFLGNARIGSLWVLSLDADHRTSPLLQLSNALIGQSVQDLPALEQEFTPSQIRQLALDRTATSNILILSASRPFGERWQFSVDVSALELTGTPASPGFGTPPVGAVAAAQSTGLDKGVALQFSGSSLIQSGDVHIFSVRVDDSPMARSATLSWDARFAIHGAWRLGPRLSVERLDDPQLGGTQMLYLPQVRSDWTSRRFVFELAAGYQISNQQVLQQQSALSGTTQTGSLGERSLYATAAYRVRF